MTTNTELNTYQCIDVLRIITARGLNKCHITFKEATLDPCKPRHAKSVSYYEYGLLFTITEDKETMRDYNIEQNEFRKTAPDEYDHKHQKRERYIMSEEEINASDNVYQYTKYEFSIQVCDINGNVLDGTKISGLVSERFRNYSHFFNMTNEILSTYFHFDPLIDRGDNSIAKLESLARSVKNDNSLPLLLHRKITD